MTDTPIPTPAPRGDTVEQLRAELNELQYNATLLMGAFIDAAGGAITIPESALVETDVTRTVYRIDNATARTITYTFTPPDGGTPTE